jgi:putative tricarboxylic transport membrane protein
LIVQPYRVAVLAVCSLSVLFAGVYFAEALRYPRGTLATPGPGLYPLFVAALIVVGALGTVVEALKRTTTEELDWPRGMVARRVTIVLAAVIAYILLLLYLGHAISGTLSALVILRAMGMKSWPRSIGLALLAGLGSHLLFTLALDVPLPGGVLFGRLIQ